jgi:hypothetical protein
METEDQLQDYVVPLGSLAILLIIVGAAVLAGPSSATSWHGIWPLLGGLLLGAFLWYSVYISSPRYYRRRVEKGHFRRRLGLDPNAPPPAVVAALERAKNNATVGK